MRVVVTGATGNIGTSVVQSLTQEPAVSEIIGLARRPTQLRLPKTTFKIVDIVEDDLLPLFRGADAVIHLAWMIQPSRDREQLESVNVDGSRRVFDAVARSQVPHLLVASSVGAYAPAPKDRTVDESWPTSGVQSSLYSRQKSAVERLLDGLEYDQPGLKVTRMRPGLSFKRDASAEIKRLFIGRLWPRSVFRRSLIPFVPGNPDLRFQAVHSSDVGEAFRLALIKQAEGAFNLAASPVLDSNTLARAFEKKVVPIPSGVLSALFSASYHLRLQPADPGWLDLALNAPIMSTARATEELGWVPLYSSVRALLELFDGLREGAHAGTMPLAARSASTV
jgi:nucleoside-diphosphate-sugar epimerase